MLSHSPVLSIPHFISVRTLIFMSADREEIAVSAISPGIYINTIKKGGMVKNNI